MDFRESPAAVEDLREAGRIVSSRWARASAYEIRNGCIVPVPGAELEYFDPWESYDELRGDERRKAGEKDRGKGSKLEMGAAPYLELLELLPQSGNAEEMKADELERITGWCTRNGLLGLLACHSSEVTLFPAWAWWHEEVDELEQAEHILVPAQMRHIRTTRTWHTLPSYDPYNDWLQPEDDDEGKPLPIKPEGRWLGPGTKWRRLGTEDSRTLSLERSWNRFFPDVPPEQAETYQYPRPESREFWLQYGEPIPDFVRALRLFRTMMERLGNEDISAGREGLRTLDALVSLLSPGGQLTEDGGLKQRWFSPALLATFAMMLLQDQTGPARVKVCPTCGNPHVSRYKTYCHERCQRNKRQDRHRDKVRRAKQLYRGGSAEAEIAIALDTKLETVRGWLLPEVKKKVRQLRREGKRYPEIAKMVGREPEWVRDQLLQASTKSPKPTPQR